MSALNSAKEIIASIVSLSLAPALKTEGFRKKRFHFTRRHGRTDQEIKLELSSWNYGSNGSFTVSIGVTFDEMRTDADDLKSTIRARQNDFFCSLDQLVPSSPQQFTVDGEIPLQQASDRLTALIIDGVVSPLNLVHSLADFEATGWAGMMPWAFPARFAYFLGRDEEAARLVAEEATFFADRGITEDWLIERYELSRLRC
jgi:Domain of unknown function (DUF4304)